MKERVIIIDTDGENHVRMTVRSGDETLWEETFERRGSVDKGLLTAIDTLFQKNILDKFVPVSVKAGEGVDRTSILYRLVLTLDAALQRPRAQNS